jgi:hypothetical protein
MHLAWAYICVKYILVLRSDERWADVDRKTPDRLSRRNIDAVLSAIAVAFATHMVPAIHPLPAFAFALPGFCTVERQTHPDASLHLSRDFQG